MTDGDRRVGEVKDALQDSALWAVVPFLRCGILEAMTKEEGEDLDEETICS